MSEFEPLQENNLGSPYMKCKPGTDLKDQDQGKAVPELRFAFLVTKDDHSGDTAGGAAQDRKNKEHGLRDAESALHCAYLINDHSGKTEQIHHKKIEYDHSSCIHKLLLSKIPDDYSIIFHLYMQGKNKINRICVRDAIPCQERLFNGGEAPQKKEMAPQCHLLFNQYYLPRR